MQKNLKKIFLFFVVCGLGMQLFADFKDILNLISVGGKDSLSVVREILEEMSLEDRERFLNGYVFIHDIPLALAAKSERLSMVKLLLKFGADFSKDSPNWYDGWLYERAIADGEIGDFLVEKYGVKGYPYLLHHYILRKNISKVKDLLEKGEFDINEVNGTGLTPLFCAVTIGDLDMIKLLIENNAKYKGKFGYLKAPLFSYTCDVKVIDYFLNELGFNIDEGIGKDGWTDTTFGLFVGSRKFELAKELLNRGADINCVINKELETILHVVSRTVNCQAVEFLLNNGVNVDVIDIENKTPYDYALSYLEEVKEETKRSGKPPAGLHKIELLQKVVKLLEEKI